MGGKHTNTYRKQERKTNRRAVKGHERKKSHTRRVMTYFAVVAKDQVKGDMNCKTYKGYFTPLSLAVTLCEAGFKK